MIFHPKTSGSPICKWAIVSLLSALMLTAHGQSLGLEIQKSAGGALELKLNGEVSRDHELEFSQDALEWEPLMSLKLPSDSLVWADPLASFRPRGFYRFTEWAGNAPQNFADNFRLNDHQGRSRELFYNTHLDAVVLIFIDPSGDDSLAATLADLENTFGSQEVEFWLIDPVSAERSELVANASDWEVDMPILHDRAQLVSRAYKVHRGTEAVAIDPTTRRIFYRGTIDRPAEGDSPAQSYLEDALTGFLAAQPAIYSRTPATDYVIPLAPVVPVSYEETIAPMLIEKCVNCHSPGNIAPFTMSDYQTIVTWAHAIRHAVHTGEMPPWFADPEHGAFENDWSLSDESARALIDWIDQGTPRGVGADPLAEFFANTPPPSDYPVNWPSELGPPDLIVSIPNQNIPANGEIDYRYIEVKPNIPADTYLRAAILKPGNRAVVHHGLVFLGTTFEAFIQGAGLNGYFAGYVPGVRSTAFPPDTGKFIPANPTLTIQMHYQANGSPQTDQTQLGLYFHTTPPATEYRTTAASTTSINIPATAREYTREATVVLSDTEETILYELSPHMHYRGTRMEYDAIYPGGDTEKLLSVPNYIFDWQLLYRLAEPKVLPAGTVIRVRGAFDNSAQNPYNPNPAVSVGFGEQSDEEMFIGYINFGVRR
ncbi:MAG: hypothetical protein ACSHYF_05465 [Verrucomicrobiaceae bacterium]